MARTDATRRAQQPLRNRTTRVFSAAPRGTLQDLSVPRRFPCNGIGATEPIQGRAHSLRQRLRSLFSSLNGDSNFIEVAR